jgi:hypothetical protein
MADYEFNLPVKSDQLQAIGMVACEWSYLESIIEAAIWNLAGLYHEDIGMAITTHLGMPPRLDMLLTLYHQHHGDDDKYKALKKLCDNIRRPLSAARGGVVHRRWVEGEYGSPMQFVVTARGKLEQSKKGRPASEIRGVARQIAEKSKELRDLLGVNDAWSPP